MIGFRALLTVAKKLYATYVSRGNVHFPSIVSTMSINITGIQQRLKNTTMIKSKRAALISSTFSWLPPNTVLWTLLVWLRTV